MKPYYEDDAVKLYHGDCLEHPELWTCADVLVTDPPYGIAWEQPAYLTKGRSSGNRSKAQPGIQNDHDTGARDAALVLWGEKPALVFGAVELMPPNTKRTLVWRKPADSGLFGSSIWRKDWEPIFMCGKWPQMPATESSVVETAHGSHREYAQGVHPHAKPIDTLQRLITKCPPGTIADPFMGSGSTIRAAKNLGRKAIGIEIDERYCEIAAKRLGQEVLDFGAAS